MRGDEVAHLGAELIDQEGAAVADRPAGRRADLFADAGRQGREGQARQNIIGMIEAMLGDDLFDVGGRPMDGDEPVVVDVAVADSR